MRYAQNEYGTAVARYSLAVDRRIKRDGEQTADFIPCVAFGKAGEWAEKWLRKGIKIAVTGRIQTGSYTNKEGQKVYTTEVIIEEQEFAESKAASEGHSQQGQGYNQGYGQGQGQQQRQAQPQQQPAQGAADGFMDIPDGLDDELPFN